MLKRLNVPLFCSILFLSQSGLVFAGSLADESTVEEVSVEEAIVEDVAVVDGYGGGGMYYGGNGFYFNVVAKAFATPESLIFYGDYSASSYNDPSLNTRKKMLAHLNSVFSKLNKKLNGLGTLTQTGSSVYSSYMSETESSFDGYLSVRFDLTSVGNFSTVKSIFSDLAVNYWLDAVVSEEDKIDAEASVATTLKSLINKKKSVYEAILDYSLTKIVSLNVYSWPDASLYNAETGLVPLSVYADVTYSSEE